MEYNASNLHHAVISGDLDAVTQALRNDNANAKDSFGSYPVLDAIKLGRVKIACVLIDAGAQLDIFDDTGESPLSAAWARGDVHLLHLILDVLKRSGVNINAGLDSPNRSLIYEDTQNPCSRILRSAGLLNPYA
jgi:ankyrin repeat protein